MLYSGEFVTVPGTPRGAVEDIGRRLTQGDPTLGWDGSPDLSIHVLAPVGAPYDEHGRPRPHIFEVRGIDARGQEYVALRWPRCDASLIRRLVEIDNRRSSAFERSRKAHERMQREKEHRMAEHRGETVEKLAWALKRDLGHQHGGLTKTIL